MENKPDMLEVLERTQRGEYCPTKEWIALLASSGASFTTGPRTAGGKFHAGHPPR